MSGRKGQFLFTIILVLLVFGLGSKIVNAQEQEPEDPDVVQEKIEEAIFSEFDFDEIESCLLYTSPSPRD